MVRLIWVLSFCFVGFLQIGCSPQGGDLSETVTESDVEEYERMLAESDASSNEE